MAEKKVFIRISGMTCAHCEDRVVHALNGLEGISSAKASFPKRYAEATYDDEKVTEPQMKAAVEAEGYKALSMDAAQRKHPVFKVIPIFLAIIGIYLIIRFTVGFDFLNMIPRIDATVSLLALFTIGLLTSIHCIGMCGGINLSQSVGTEDEGKKGRFKRPLLYNLGRVISYTVVGGIVGGLGSLLFISSTAKGIIMLVAAVFMILMSLAMLGWLPHFLVPRLPKKLTAKMSGAKSGRGPFIVGLLNGLMPCGPLQAMQIYALSTGSIWMGALSMFIFSVGTVPLMLGAGLIFSLLKGRFTRIITRVSAVLVMLVAVVMLVNATGFFGWDPFAPALPQTVGNAAPAPAQTTLQPSSKGALPGTFQGFKVAKIDGSTQSVQIEVGPSSYGPIIVQKGIPLKFNLHAEEKNLNGCNGTVIFPGFDTEKELKPGDNIVAFTPGTSGNFPYFCYMAMIKSNIIVVDDLKAYIADPASKPEADAKTTGGSCCQ